MKTAYLHYLSHFILRSKRLWPESIPSLHNFIRCWKEEISVHIVMEVDNRQFRYNFIMGLLFQNVAKLVNLCEYLIAMFLALADAFSALLAYSLISANNLLCIVMKRNNVQCYKNGCAGSLNIFLNAWNSSTLYFTEGKKDTGRERRQEGMGGWRKGEGCKEKQRIQLRKKGKRCLRFISCTASWNQGLCFSMRFTGRPPVST